MRLSRHKNLSRPPSPRPSPPGRGRTVRASRDDWAHSVKSALPKEHPKSGGDRARVQNFGARRWLLPLLGERAGVRADDFACGTIQDLKFGPRKGVALIITLIMLAVITFMAVTFLALSRREAGAVRVSTDQITAANAAQAGTERVKAQMLATILATTNIYSFDLLVSTNYVNWLGFDPSAGANPTNVNYGYRIGGNTPLSANDARQNLANLLYDARPPVFVTNRFFPNSNEFRFYLDLNRNGRYDTNGYWPVIGRNGGFYHLITNGNSVLTLENNDPVNSISNYLVGDPEWHGILSRPEYPHSSTNQFIGRYAFIVIPTGKTLDVNYVHNQAKQPAPNLEGFFRNQGVGSWEINLAGFLADLNTNLWLVPPSLGGYALDVTPPYYRYSTSLNPPTIGAAFDDAQSLVYYRYANNYRNSLLNLQGTFGPLAVPALGLNYVDDYSGGPLMTNFWGWNVAFDPDNSAPRSTQWRFFGSENPNHYFTTQDLFDTTKVQPRTGYDFVERLKIAGTNNSSYDRYTYYRLLSQLGTDSAPEPPGKIHLNYDNKVRANAAGVVSATNFYQWNATDFFTNAANALLSRYTEEWRKADFQIYTNLYGTNQAFGLSSIPVRVNSNFVYTPSLHRVLQLAANLTDTITNRLNLYGKDFPSVFRPIIRKSNAGDVYIVGYTSVERVAGGMDPQFAKPLDLNIADDLARVPLLGTTLRGRDEVNVYGVPWVIGAKKGLPNFNEFAMQSIFQITRKLEVVRPSQGAPKQTWRTNMMYLVAITNVIGVEAWNSYRTNFDRAVDIYVTDDLTMVLTNNFWPTGIRKDFSLLPQVAGGVISIPATGPQQWRGFQLGATNSFLVALRTNVPFLTNAAYHSNPPRFEDDPRRAWDTSQTFPQPRWGLSITNRLRFITVDRASQRVIDYVHLDSLNGQRDLSEEIRDDDNAVGFDGLWSTNLLAGGLPQGIKNQIDVSLGNYSGDTTDWNGFGLGQATGNTKDFAIDYFRALYGLTPLKYQGLVNTNLAQQVPFTPTRRISQYLTWQANDPLVHYTAGDLANLATAESIVKHSLKTPVQAIKNIGVLNDRYEPWGGNPSKTGGAGGVTDPKSYNLALKDPGVARSDDWQFPTNKFPNIGWLGRVHRGTPWQTVYLKSPEILTDPNGLGTWTNWTGNSIGYLSGTNLLLDAARSVPESDRLLFEVFTTALNENATRGQLPINQTNLAAWSALFSGVAALTNASTDAELTSTSPTNRFGTVIINPVGLDETLGVDKTNSPLWKIVDGINRRRDIRYPNGAPVYPGQAFKNLGDILSVPELSTNSPFLNRSTPVQLQKGINDAVYEWLPQQVLGLLRTGEPRFVVYSFGQTLRPARNSLYLGSGLFNGMCTNYQVTAEVATRTVLRVDGSPDPANINHPDPARRYPPRIVVESYNHLPPD